MSGDIDVVISGHTHRAYNCSIGTKLVTSAASYGRLITDVDLRIDRRTGRVVTKSAHNVVVTRDVVKDAGETALLDRYRPLAAKVGNRPVGSIAAIIRRAANEAGESALGDVVADAMLDGASDPERGGAVVALMNPGGIRADLAHASPTGSEEAGAVTYADAFNVLPFGNIVIVKTLTGNALGRLLEQQFDNPRPGQSRMLQVSNGFEYSYDPSRPTGRRVDRTSIAINGRNLEPAARYRVAMPDFLWSGGDGLTVAKEGSNPTPGDRDVDLFAAHIEKHSPLGPGPRNRVHRRP
jgi:5'-nucleotidase